MRIEVIAAIVAFAFMPCAAVAADYYLIGLDNNGHTNSSLSGAGDPPGWSLTDGGSTRDAKGMTASNNYHVTSSNLGYVNMPCYDGSAAVDNWASPVDAPIFVLSGTDFWICSRGYRQGSETASLTTPYYRSVTDRSILLVPARSTTCAEF